MRAVVMALLLWIGPSWPAAAHQERGAGLPSPELRVPAPREAIEALDRWDLAAAQAAIGRFPVEFGAWIGILRSNLAYYGGHYEEAVSLLRGLPPEVRNAPTLAEYAGRVEATLEMRKKLRAVESAHFVLWHDPQRDWVLVEPALEALESGYQTLGEWLGDFPRDKIRIEILSSAEDFERVTSLTRKEIETSGAIGICKFNKIMVLSPRLLVWGYRWRDVLAHEYLHYLQVRLSANRAPIWLQEGVARYGESRWRAAEPTFLEDLDRSLIARALRDGSLIGFDVMDPSLVRLPSLGAVRLAFAECALAVDYLIRGWRVEGLRRVFAALAESKDYGGMDPVLRTALGVSLETFEAGWREDLAGRGFRETPGAILPRLRLAGPGAQDAEGWDLAEWQPVAAQNHLRLGDLLRARGKDRAALLEYEKARKVSPSSPYVLVKIARLQMRLGAPAAAAAAAREAVRSYGDYPAGHEALAGALAALGEWEGAREALTAALEINPYNPYVWRDLGTAQRRGGRDAQARRSFETALRLDPDDEETRRRLQELR